MTYENIYELSLMLLGEDRDTPATADYAARAPRLINIAAASLSHIDGVLYNKEHTVSEFRGDSLNYTFPLSEQLHEVCAFMVASMLICDAHHDFAALLDTKAKEYLARLAKESVTVTSTVEVY